MLRPLAGLDIPHLLRETRQEVANNLFFIFHIKRGKALPGGLPGDGRPKFQNAAFALHASRARELKPFAAAIDAGLSMILLAHILYPAVDPDAPVALSRRFATNILREELGFAGVAVSDDIGMGAMKGLFDSPDAAVRLIESGCDMVMVCAHFTGTGRARGFAHAILAAAEDGRLDAELLARSRARIENLLARVPSNKVELLPESAFRADAGTAALYDAATVEVV